VHPIQVGEVAPPVPGVPFEDGPFALLFYKVTCPVCQMAAPKVGRFKDAYPGRLVALGQDPAEELAAFGREFAMDVPAIPDLPPYEVSNAYGIESVPTLVLVGKDAVVLENVEAWDREGYNRVSARLAGLIGAEPVAISTPDDGLPAFKPG
jgi:thiol-disulfide isomerase/thioredoxin